MANTARTQQSLAGSGHFVSRLAAALVAVAWVVIEEAPTTEFHAERLAFARRVIGNPQSYAAQMAPVVVMRTNVIAFTTSYDFDLGAVVTASGDPDLQAQLTADWNVWAGV